MSLAGREGPHVFFAHWAQIAMRQTLLALVALLTATLLNYNQMQANLQEQKQVIRSEVEQMALGIAMQTMEVIRARAFDEETLDPDGVITNPEASLTAPGLFPEGLDCEAFGGEDTCDDIDDFNEMKTAVESFEFRTLEGFKEMDFNVDVEVRYVDDDMEACVGEEQEWPGCTSVGPTFRKEVIIKVQDKRENPYLQRPIRFTEVITYY